MWIGISSIVTNFIILSTFYGLWLEFFSPHLGATYSGGNHPGGGWGGGFENSLIGHKALFLSNHRTSFNITAWPGIISDGWISVKLRHLKNSGITPANNILLIITYTINPDKLLPIKQYFWIKLNIYIFTNIRVVYVPTDNIIICGRINTQALQIYKYIKNYTQVYRVICNKSWSLRSYYYIFALKRS